MKLLSATTGLLQTSFLGLLVLWFFTSPISAQLVPARPPKVISSYRELLDWLPKDFLPRRGEQWTQVQKDAANEFFAKKLQTEAYTVDMKLEVSDVPVWNDKLQIYSDISNREGYHIRFFGIIPDSKKPQLTKVKIGDRVRVTGKLTRVGYQTLWNEFTLSIVCNPADLTK